jgi:predicted RNA-binding Zn-ribbon protein involved in translation (DUF1610 family)
MDYVQFSDAASARAAFALAKNNLVFKCAICGGFHNFALDYYLVRKNNVTSHVRCVEATELRRIGFSYEPWQLALVPEEMEKIIDEKIMLTFSEKDAYKKVLDVDKYKHRLYKTIKKLYACNREKYPYSYAISDNEENVVNFNSLKEAGHAKLDDKFRCPMCGDIHTVYNTKEYTSCISNARIGRREINVKHLLLTPAAFIREHIGRRAQRIFGIIEYFHFIKINPMPLEYLERLAIKNNISLKDILLIHGQEH